MAEGALPVPCPRCGEGRLSAVATAPFARGFLIAYTRGTKKIAGCKKCVAKGLRAEAGKSLLFGWFSITALIANAFFIPYNLFRSLFISDDHLAVSKFFDEIGVPEPGTEYRIADACQSAAVAMIRADGKIEASEVNAAKILGQQILSDFNPDRIDDLLTMKGPVQPIDAIATVFRVYLNPNGQELVIKYLLGIAMADGDFHKSEDKYIERVADKMGYGRKPYKELRDQILDT